MRRIGLLALFVVVAGLGVAALPGDAISNETINYSYDARGQLVQAKRTGTVNNNVISNYAYDKANNRTLLNVTGAP